MADVAEVLGPVAGCSGPRGEFAYSNGGYAVLGQLIADLTGTSFAQAATRLVLEPLGLADSWFPAGPPVSPDAACGYSLDDEGALEREQPQVFTLQSAGGLWSTGPDLVGDRSRLGAAALDGRRRPGRDRAGLGGLADHAPRARAAPSPP
jgi:CubicO group peptidase (beta-lactamase class C family)